MDTAIAIRVDIIHETSRSRDVVVGKRGQDLVDATPVVVSQRIVDAFIRKQGWIIPIRFPDTKAKIIVASVFGAALDTVRIQNMVFKDFDFIWLDKNLLTEG